MPHAGVADPVQGGVARLVEAERLWQAALDEERSRARDTVAKATAIADARDAAAHDECRAAVAARARELDGSVADAADAARSELAGRTLRYSDPSPALIERLAAMIADRAPWFASAGEAP
jgi:hypothetical protein